MVITMAKLRMAHASRLGQFSDPAQLYPNYKILAPLTRLILLPERALKGDRSVQILQLN